ncbi:MAG TPA: tyrosine-type recombinase/integrase [Vicinamibacterales bacterium]|nr:tyrosine-type recombinase/integrase [Vicinamibacterales bacterium]
MTRSTSLERSAHLREVAEPASASILEFPAPAAKSRKPVNGSLPPRRRPNAELRSREYLLPDEVDRLIKAARNVGRHGHRDGTMLLIAYRHALRVSELVALRWDQVDLKGGTLHVARLKNGRASVHPLRGPELRALRRVRRDYPDTPYIFASERGGPITASTVRSIVTRAGQVAKLSLKVHPHMLRHAAGYKLANDGHDTRAIQQYLGHKNIMHTVRYTELAPQRFSSFWKD